MATNQSQALKRIGENLYVNGHGVYFAWFVVRGKQIKRSCREDFKVGQKRAVKVGQWAGPGNGGGEWAWNA